MPTSKAGTKPARIEQSLFRLLLMTAALGCGHHNYCCPEGLSERILPPPGADAGEQNSLDKDVAPEPAGGSRAGLKPAKDAPRQDTGLPASTTAGEISAGEAGPTLTLAQAIKLAFRQQPRLRVYLETTEQARGAEEIAFAPFLPVAVTSYSIGGFDVDAGGLNVLVGSPAAFRFIPAIGAVPVGFDVHTGYELADLKLQWLICDFGKRLGRYRQAGLAADIAELQTQRAYQTVANEVAVAYYQLLRTRALSKTAREAVRRAEDDLDVARKLARGGVLEKEKVLRAEVQLAENQRLLDAAEGAEAVAIAALNLAIGLNVNAPTRIEETSDIPAFKQSLAECLQTAVGLRREFQVARTSIQAADEGRRVAKADFAPRIVADGSLLDFQQAAPRGHADLALGFIKLEWGLFEGGKRVAELRVSDSKIRAAMAQAESIADTIAFQVTEAYRQLVTARLGIDRSRPSVTQAEENDRLVRARFRQGDATSADITDAESTLTRAQQAYLNSIHDYLIALARLEYAMGVTPTPGNASCGR
jgi:outer membrane protein TolC